MFPLKAFSVLSHWQCPVTCAWIPVKCSIHSRSTNPLHDCTIALLMLEAHHNLAHSTCKSFHAPPFMLLIVLYNSVYYNYIIIMHWLVGWLVGSGIKEKGGLRWQKSALWCCALEFFFSSFVFYELTASQVERKQ